MAADNEIDLGYYEALQAQYAAQITIPAERGGGYSPSAGDIWLALDVQYDHDTAYIGADVQRANGRHIGCFALTTHTQFPYIPGLFCFREGAVLATFIQSLEALLGLRPDLLLIDGHGTAHPRRFGVACWLGLHTHIPAIGCAKDSLLPYEGDRLAASMGAYLPLHLGTALVGYALRTREGVKPVFVSAGYGISQATAKDLVQQCATVRVPEPLRRADSVCRAHARGVQHFALDGKEYSVQSL